MGLSCCCLCIVHPLRAFCGAHGRHVHCRDACGRQIMALGLISAMLVALTAVWWLLVVARARVLILTQGDSLVQASIDEDKRRAKERAARDGDRSSM